MTIKQISVFLENKEGRIKKAVEVISKAEINIRALSIADNTKYGILRLIVSDNEKTKEVLKANHFIVKESEVIVIGVEDKPNGLNSVLELFENAKINVEYLYAFVSSKTDKAIVVVKIENYESGIKALKEGNADILTEKDIAE
ncbi:MAG: acetolactate synthase, partial [Methanobacteriaceae archaeon]|nr:acetolactate synthase [Methanobacteriaceae archaeon]